MVCVVAGVEGLPFVLWDRSGGALQLMDPVRRSHIKLSPLRSLLLSRPTLTLKSYLPSVPRKISIIYHFTMPMF